MQAERPYLSIVATARNDDHGANLLRRVQIFLDALVEQAKRYDLPIELILVDWNPPPGKPPLAEALRWPEPGPCRFRVLTVPAEWHNRYRHHQALPLYQMIAKNVGIRRAQGEFILATNIDILFSSELMEFFASRRLERGRMYRIDRHDVDAGVPADVPVDAQLEYCRTHRIRINAREGTFALMSDGSFAGMRKLGKIDVVSASQGIFFGRGWYSPEQHFGQVFRWAGEESEIIVLPSPRRRILQLETEGGPGTGFAPFRLRLLDAQANAIHETAVERRATVRVRVEPQRNIIRLAVSGGGRALVNGRLLNFRIFRCKLLPDSAKAAPLAASRAPIRPLSRFREVAVGGARFLWSLPWHQGPIRIGLPFGGASGWRLDPGRAGGSSISFGRYGSVELPESPPADLHTNACGDFTLAHRSHWMELRGYPEFDLYSMNIDSVFCFMAHYGGAKEHILQDPMRIYHIDHASGSGWSPEGETLLYERLAAKGIPWVDFPKVLNWAADMERLSTTMIFNGENWGLAELDPPEVNPMAASH